MGLGFVAVERQPSDPPEVVLRFGLNPLKGFADLDSARQWAAPAHRMTPTHPTDRIAVLPDGNVGCTRVAI
jgi:hypothetical protein